MIRGQCHALVNSFGCQSDNDCVYLPKQQSKPNPTLNRAKRFEFLNTILRVEVVFVKPQTCCLETIETPCGKSFFCFIFETLSKICTVGLKKKRLEMSFHNF